MSEINNIVDKNAIDGIIQADKALTSFDNTFLKVVRDIEEGKKIINQNKISFDGLKKAQEKTTETTKNLDKLGKQLLTTEQKLKEFEDKRTKSIIANKVEVQKLTAETKRQVVAQTALKGSYEKINAELNTNIARYKKLSAEERNNNKVGGQLLATIKKQDAALKKLDAQMGRSQRNVGNYGAVAANVGRQLLGALGFVGGVTALVGVIKSAFSTIRSFTKENAVLAGVLGVTRKEVELLTKQAVQLGSIYPVLASEVTKLQVSFARLGFTQSDIINLTEATIQGSIALNASLDQTATLVGAVVKAYGDLGTSDAGIIIDKLTLATQKSSLSFASLEQALPKVAGAANAVNSQLSKTLSLLGIAQDATLDASIAGTSLRNIFLELAKKGLTLNEGLNTINNSSNRLTAAYDLFGKRAAIVGLALADNIEKIDEFESALDDAGGTAQRVAEEQMKTLDGAIKSTESSWEKFILRLRGSEGVLTNVVNIFSTQLDTMSDEFATFTEKLIALNPFGRIFGLTKIKDQMKSRTELLSFIQTATEEEIKIEVEKNKELILGNEKFNDAVVDAITLRLEQIEKSEDEAAKRKKIRAQQDALSLIALGREQAEETLKREKKEEKEFIAAQDKLVTARERALKLISDSNEEFEDEEEKRNDNSVELFTEREEKKVAAQAKAAEERLKQAQQEAKDQEELAEQTRDILFEIGSAGINALFDIGSAKRDEEINQINKQKELALQNENLTKEGRIAIEEEAARRISELKQRQAKADKQQALFNIAINTAEAILKVTAQTGVLSPFVIPGIITLGAIQAAVVAGTPIPEFKDGTTNTPSEFIAGEAGRELIYGNGMAFIVNEPTYFKDKKFQGLTVKPNKETEKILSSTPHSGFNGGVFSIKDDQIIGELKGLRKDMRNQKQPISKNGVVTGYRFKNGKVNLINKYRHG